MLKVKIAVPEKLKKEHETEKKLKQLEVILSELGTELSSIKQKLKNGR